MSSEPQVLLFDGALSEDDLPVAFAALDAEAALPLRPDLRNFLKDVVTVEGVSEAEAVGGRAVLVTAPPEHIARIAEYILRYRPPATTAVEPLTYSILRHWTDIEAVFEQDAEVDPEAEARAQAVLDSIIEALRPALAPLLSGPFIHAASHGGEELVAVWRRLDAAHVLLVECRVEVYGPEIHLAATVTSTDSIDQWNRDEPEDPLDVASAELWEVEAMDEAESWAVTVISPTRERVLAAAYDDLEDWITRSLAAPAS